MSYLLALASGVLLSFSFKPLALWFAAPLAIALLIYVAEKSGKYFISILLFALSFNALTLIWSNKYVGITPWLALVLLQTLFFLPLALLKRLGANWYFFLPVSFIALEEVRARFPFGGFGWLRIGFGQVDAPYVRLASFGGVSLLSLATILLGVGTYLLAQRGRGLTLPAIAIVLAMGALLLPPNNSPRPTFSVLAIQGSVPKLGLDFNERATQVFYRHLAQSERAIKKSKTAKNSIDLILWPENSVDVDPFTNKVIGDRLTKLATQSNIPVLVGAVIRNEGKLQNASILWRPKTGADSVYLKRHLTPFGEYMPLRSALTFFSSLPNQIEDFSPGSELVIHRVGQAKIVPVICFELIDDRLVQVAANKSNFFAVQTNSATFADTAQSAQQLAITRIRSIEHARYSVSVSTIGISAIIDTNGVILKSSKEKLATFLSGSVALNETKTIYDQIGSYAWLLVLLIGLGLALTLRQVDRVLKRR